MFKIFKIIFINTIIVLFISKVSHTNEDKIKINNEIYTYIFRDYYVAMEYFLENFKDAKILSPENLKNEFTDNINKLRIKVSK